MLKEITISNYALIDYLRIDLSKGFTTITGETGAGKSIILGGLSLALGKRAEPNLVKDKTKKCFVDLIFSLKNLELKNLFNSLDLDYDTLTTIRREIIPSGKSRAFVNDTPVNLEILQKLSFELIDIHSQFQNHFIIKEEYQMDILDLLAKNQNLIEKYTLNFSHFKEVKNKINKLESSRFNMNQEKDYNTYLLNEINSIDFSDSLDSMEKALEKISNSEEINTTFNQISNILQNEEDGISIKLNEVRVSLKKITNISNEYKRIFERIESVIIELDDIVRDVRNENDIMEFNPEMREILSEKLEKIYSLFRKHQVDKLDDLILIKGKLEKKVSEYTLPSLWRFYQPSKISHGSYWHYWGTEEEVAWRENYKLWMTFVNEYKNRGGKVNTGSDSGFIFQLYGFAYIREMELLREAGFHPLEVIRAATLSGAETLKMDDKIGTIEVGKFADMVLVDSNPLENLKVLYGTGAIKLNENNEVVRVGGIKYTISNGVIYDAKGLLNEVKMMVDKAKEEEGFEIKQPGVN